MRAVQTSKRALTIAPLPESCFSSEFVAVKIEQRSNVVSGRKPHIFLPFLVHETKRVPNENLCRNLIV